MPATLFHQSVPAAPKNALGREQERAAVKERRAFFREEQSSQDVVSIRQFRARLIALPRRFLRVYEPSPELIIGRRMEVDKVLQHVFAKRESPVKVLFCSGPDGVLGGTGKTTLAQMIASKLKDTFLGSHIEVSLGGTSQPITVDAAKLQVLRTLELLSLGESVEDLSACYDMLFHAEPPGPLFNGLLLLDNAGDEHTDVLSQLTAPLRSTSCILITSRARLSVANCLLLDVGVLQSSDAITVLTNAWPQGELTIDERSSLSELAVKHCHCIPYMLRHAADQFGSPFFALQELLDACRQCAKEGYNTILRASYKLLSAELQATLLRVGAFRVPFRREVCPEVFSSVRPQNLIDLLKRGYLQRSRLPLASLHEIMREFCQLQAAESNMPFKEWIELTELYFASRLNEAEQYWVTQDRAKAEQIWNEDQEGLLAVPRSRSPRVLEMFVSSIQSLVDSLYVTQVAHADLVKQLLSIAYDQRFGLNLPADSFQRWQTMNLLGKAYIISHEPEKAEAIFRKLLQLPLDGALRNACILQLVQLMHFSLGTNIHPEQSTMRPNCGPKEAS